LNATNPASVNCAGERSSQAQNAAGERPMPVIDHAMVALLALDQIQREAGNTFEVIIRAANASHTSEIANLQAQGQQSIRALDRLVSDIDPDISQELSELLRGLRSTIMDEGSIFSWARKSIEAPAQAGGIRSPGGTVARSVQHQLRRADL
jgi:hypothetical protein